MTTEQSWFDLTYRRHFAFIKKTALAIGITHHIRCAESWAEDMTQSTFTSLLETVMADGIPESENIRGLLIVYLRNTIGNWFQKSANQECVFAEVGEDIPDAPASDPTDGISYPKELTAGERDLLNLYYYYGYSTTEIANYYHISNDACRQRLRRAREHFKKLRKKENLSTNFARNRSSKGVLLEAGGTRNV